MAETKSWRDGWMQMLPRFFVTSTRPYFSNQECQSADSRCARDTSCERDLVPRSESQVTRIGGITEDAQFKGSGCWTPPSKARALFTLQACSCNLKAKRIWLTVCWPREPNKRLLKPFACFSDSLVGAEVCYSPLRVQVQTPH